MADPLHSLIQRLRTAGDAEPLGDTELLACPRGTVLSRLANARRRLRPRLERRGVAPALPLAPPSLPEKLVATTVPLSQSAAAPAHIVSLSNGVIRTMFWNRLRIPLA